MVLTDDLRAVRPTPGTWWSRSRPQGPPTECRGAWSH